MPPGKEPGTRRHSDTVVVLEEPNLDRAGHLSYSVEVLEGTVPTHAVPVTLFIDPFGRSRSPISVCECGGESGDACDDGRSDRRAEGHP